MIETIFNHRSIRKYASREIESEVLNNILEAGTRAATTGNMQVYSIIVTKDSSLKQRLWEAHFKQEMVLKAPLILTFCADFNRFSKWCEARNADPGYDNFLSFFTGAIDALLAAQNVALAAEANGLGTCYLGTTTYMAGKIVDILNCPRLVVPVTTLVIGYPEDDPGLTDRLPVDGVVHLDQYTDYSRSMIDEIYKLKEGLPQTRELLKINEKETLAQIFTEKRYTRKDNVLFSKAYLEVIAAQGFMSQ
jgi:FMN reductase (NADPH)